MAKRRQPPITIVDGDADTAQIAEFERDRRELLRRGIAAGGAVVAASSIPLLLSVRKAFAAQEGDLGILESAIKLERVAVLAYDTLIDRGLLSARVERVAKLFLAQEQEHADELVAALTALRGTVPPKPAGVKDIDDVVEGIGDVKSQADVLHFAIELETSAVAAYYDASRELVDAKLLQTAASIMANEGQHLVVLRQAAGKPPVPHALETGEEE
ncbi:MAG: ferritin-like domain-containing protein [Actinomycetota bacterium]|nr:ferritin-like domain-containing protein [Actinomycetota bacterium]